MMSFVFSGCLGTPSTGAIKEQVVQSLKLQKSLPFGHPIAKHSDTKSESTRTANR